ncbi:simple sugar transport system permease protein [Tindallia magadiensis]|uniref:Simple sugar transport system permease protein n=1 Tax=Tindallia magadiensis TaxID=69895 RepID=A0A1I3AQQ8_9FIRM|nr:ABC transporter permease [Tindallia magadiensis]SFH52332.1 simple sugar transport system permease protein [Tindallia magadiensis]
MDSLFNLIFSTTFGYSVLRVTTPILFATLGAMISIKAGVVNISMEGTMLTAALMGVVISGYTGSALAGLIGAVLIGMLLGLMLGYFALNLKTNIILAAIAINLMASGGTVFALFVISGDRGISSSINSQVLPRVSIPILENIPILGDILSNHNILTYVSLLSVFLVYVFLYKTPLGLQIRAVGENSHAAESVGISVRKVQYIALILSGAFAGFGGAYMSMGYVSRFSTDMTAGRGFIALAAEALGMGRPLGILLASLLFGAADALSNSLQRFKIPSEFVQMLPYLVTIIGLIIYAIRQKNALKRQKMEDRV